MISRQAALAARVRRGRRTLNQVADLVSDGYSVAAAGRAAGVSQQRSSVIWRTIKQELGAQAV